MKGQIVWFHPERNFGFIENSDGKWFFHGSNVVAGLKPELGVFIEFELADPISLKNKKKHAVRVRAANVDAMVEGVMNAMGGVGGQQ